MGRYDKLMRFAKKLEKKVDTDWAYKHEYIYFRFADKIEAEYAAGRISGREFNDLALTAFYDYPEGLKEEK